MNTQKWGFWVLCYILNAFFFRHFINTTCVHSHCVRQSHRVTDVTSPPGM